MTTATMQLVAALPFPGTPRLGLLNGNDFCANSGSLKVTAINSARALKPRNAAPRGSKVIAERSFCNGYGDKKQSSRLIRVKKLIRASRYGAEEAAPYAVEEVTDEDFDKQVQPSDIRVLAATRSRYNYITVMEVAREADHLLAGARLLLLDNPGCLHSVYYDQNVLTNSYYDVLATIVPLLPDGPVGILGLGAGATSRILHHFFPALDTHGWELDPDIIDVARHFFDMSRLEGSEADQSEVGSGKLTVHIGDALGPDVCVEGGFAGLIVDLFAEGRLLPPLQEPRTWEQLKAKLRPGGRIIVNCGGDRMTVEKQTKSAGQLYMEETIAAMNEVFAGELSSRYLARKGFNTVAITGPSPDVSFWTQALPEPLRNDLDDVLFWNTWQATTVAKQNWNWPTTPADPPLAFPPRATPLLVA